MKKKKILYISGSRADFGRMTYILRAIQKRKQFTLKILVTGQHLLKKFGRTYEEIKKEFGINGVIDSFRGRVGSLENMSQAFGRCIIGLTKKIQQIKPNLIILLGDRGEMLAGAFVGAQLNIPVAHIGGGQMSGSIDDKIRRAISIFSNFHLVATKEDAKRVLKLTNEPKNIFIVGAPDLEAIRNKDFTPPAEIYKKFKLEPNEKIILLSQHPVTEEAEDALKQIKATVNALKRFPFKIIATYPNSDAGGLKMINFLKKEAKKNSKIRLYKHIPYFDYLGLMNIATLMVGNSSAGIIEAASFGLPVINIGSRQKDRKKAKNVINVRNFNSQKIEEAVRRVIFKKRTRERLRKIKNPYGDGLTSRRFISFLKRHV